MIRLCPAMLWDHAPETASAGFQAIQAAKWAGPAVPTSVLEGRARRRSRASTGLGAHRVRVLPDATRTRALDTRMATRILPGGAHTISVMIYSGLDDEELEALVRHLVNGALHAGPPAGRKRFNAGMNRRQHREL